MMRSEQPQLHGEEQSIPVSSSLERGSKIVESKFYNPEFQQEFDVESLMGPDAQLMRVTFFLPASASPTGERQVVFLEDHEALRRATKGLPLNEAQIERLLDSLEQYGRRGEMQ